MKGDGFMSMADLCRKYNVNNNFLHLLRVTSLIPTGWKNRLVSRVARKNILEDFSLMIRHNPDKVTVLLQYNILDLCGKKAS